MGIWPRDRLSRTVLAAAIAGGLAFGSTFLFKAPEIAASQAAVWRKAFARPDALPHPLDNMPSPEKIALGERLFFEPLLSANGSISCATCHNPSLSFTDGVSLSKAGVTGTALRRHTPSLWNLAWAPVLYWDGRASSLEDQARMPMSHADEMASTPEAAAKRLARDPNYRQSFRAVFANSDEITAEQILKALAAYERTLVSPPTRFDRWIAGDSALSEEEQRGFALFTGRAQCSNCHSGFAFTDYAFHDIGLPGSDPGRGPIAQVAAAANAFKTPGLRELVWTAPYMHDGSIASLDDVVRHYERGGLSRPSRSRDMPKPFRLTDEERGDLVAFLEALSSERPPKPSTEVWIGRPAAPAPAVTATVTSMISQRDKTFRPGAVRVAAGGSIQIVNDDTRTHNVRIVDPRLSINSGAQDPGESVTLKFEGKGHFEAHCGIHPTMRLSIDVE